MGAGCGVEAAIGQYQALDRPTVYQVLSYDLVHVFRLDEAVPDGFRIDDDGRAMLALVEASGFIGPNRVLQAGIFHLVLEQALQLALSVVRAGWSCAAGLAHIGADKYMPLKLRQNSYLLLPSYIPKSSRFSTR